MKTYAQSDWVRQNPLPTGNSLNAVFLTKTDSGVAVGEGGTILRATNGGVTWVKDARSGAFGVPTSIVLEQNYPNPFNPSTTIKYELPRTSKVSLAVYDVLGRELSVLVNERVEAGVHEVKFDGSNLASVMK